MTNTLSVRCLTGIDSSMTLFSSRLLIQSTWNNKKIIVSQKST